MRGPDHVAAVDLDRAVARVHGRDGRPWFDLRLSLVADTATARDETVAAPTVTVGEDGSVQVESPSAIWDRRWTRLSLEPDGLVLSGGVRGRGRLADVHLLTDRRPPRGELPSGSAVRSLFSPNPDHPSRTVSGAGASAVIGVCGSGAEPGVGRWLFTPAPWCVALSRNPSPDERTPGPGPWVVLGLTAPVREQLWTEVRIDSDPLTVVLHYQGHTQVDGEYRLPDLRLRFGAPDPYTAIAAHCARDGAALPPDIPAWWRQPLFCGWGAQVAVAQRHGTRAAHECTQANYDTFLARLGAAGIEPGTVVIDDKWCTHYATCRPDPAKWPELREWIAHRHAEGRRVLLWWKAWDVEGAPAQACVRTAAGRPVAIDPDTAAGRALVADAVTAMLSSDQGVGADGIKVDFTADTPSGESLESAGPHWGASLLHRLLEVVVTTSKAIRPDALVVTHTPNPDFADVGDMIRLNDAVWMDALDPTVDVVHQMTHRARVATAAWPGRLIDTDGWYLPDPSSWRRYTAVQPQLGVPALYYAGRFDGGHGDMTDEDFGLVRGAWSAYRRRYHLTTPTPFRAGGLR